jgi:hypothetical protein
VVSHKLDLFNVIAYQWSIIARAKTKLVKENEFIPFMLVTIAMVRPVLELGLCQGTGSHARLDAVKVCMISAP